MLCDIMVNDTDISALDRYVKVNELMLAVTQKNCTDFKYLKSVKDLQQTTWNSSAASGERQCKFIIFHDKKYFFFFVDKTFTKTHSLRQYGALYFHFIYF